MSKVFNAIVNIIFYPLIVCVIAIVIMYAMGVHTFITMSGSMEPAIHTGSLCFVNTKADYNDIEVDDIIAYEVSTGAKVTHRVIDVTPEGLETKGDANDHSDGISVNEGNFIGETIFSVPYVGYVVKYVQNPTVLIILGILIVGGIALSYIDSKEKDSLKSEDKDVESEGASEDGND